MSTSGYQIRIVRVRPHLASEGQPESQSEFAMTKKDTRIRWDTVKPREGCFSTGFS